MQDRKENSAGFVKTIKKKVHDWASRHPWITGSILSYVYFIVLFCLFAFVCAVIFANFNLFHTDADSARYMLSALVQSQAAIVAIVITLTLIAIQLTASAYSPRVVDIFKKNPDMWILLLFYGVSISYGLLVLKMIQAGDLRQISLFSHPLEYHIFSAYIAVVFTFFMLFPYMWNIISLLKSENIIKRLAIEITKGKLLNSKEDPIQPIMNIVHGSIMKYDLETTRIGLKEVTERVIEVIGPDEEEKISERFCNHLRRVSRLAISREDEESTVEVIENLKNFGRSTAEEGLENATCEAAWSLGKVGISAVEKGLENAASQAALSLEGVGISAAEKGLKDATLSTASSLREVGISAVEKRLEDAACEAAWSLGKVGISAVEKGLENTRHRKQHCLLEKLEELLKKRDLKMR
jgi:hypothetical protein